ncbi:MAG: YopX family protein [Pirellulales bacterium]
MELANPSPANRFHFRAWDTEAKRMYRDEDEYRVNGRRSYPIRVSSRGIHYCTMMDRNTPESDYIVRDEQGREGYTQWEEDKLAWQNLVLMQSTGLLDKNGKEIFEGDVIQMHWSKTDIGVYPVVWRDSGFEFYPAARFHPDGDELEIAEVIGNIYESPELLNP